LTEQTIYINTGEDKIINLDADVQGSFIAYTDNKIVITDDYKIRIDKEIRFPFIRRINNERFLLADSRTNKYNLPNVHIYDIEEQVQKSFFAGDGIQDIVIQANKIIITYFDEGVFGSSGPNKDGVAVFDFNGNQVFGFNSSAIWGFIVDCYCICKDGTNQVLFYGYTDFKMYELNLNTLKIEVFTPPKKVSGASAISSIKGEIIFHSPYDDESSFFLWERNTNLVNKIGEYSQALKGLKNGNFLAFGDKGYTIVNPIE
jgi:hypothetical protein